MVPAWWSLTRWMWGDSWVLSCPSTDLRQLRCCVACDAVGTAEGEGGITWGRHGAGIGMGWSSSPHKRLLAPSCLAEINAKLA